MPALSLNLLGGFGASLDGSPLLLPTKTGQALLAYLALTPELRHSREKLAALLWEDRAEPQARTSLRQTLAVLRKAVEAADIPWLRGEGDTLTLNRDVVDVDVRVFEESAAKATRESLAQAAALYKGDLLQGFNLRSESFADWLRSERERLHERALQVLTTLLGLQQERGDIDAGIATASRLLALDPLREQAHRALMHLYVAQGRHGSALRQYEVCRDLLRRELDVAPEPDTEALYREIRTQRSVASATPAVHAAKAARPELPLSDHPAIAILPFANLSGDPEQAYLSDGITEDIITELARYRSLLVIARSSSFQFRGPAIDIAAVRQKLGVRYVVEGSVRNAGTTLRVSAQLIDAGSESHLWAERYDRDTKDIFAIQQDLASAVAATLEGRIAARGAEHARRKPTKDWHAYDYFLQGRELMHRYCSVEAEAMFARAVALDPTYVHAHAWRSITLTSKYVMERAPDTIEQACSVARRALELDDADAWSHHAMGYVRLWRGELDLAGMHFDRAITLNPNDVNIAGDRANWLMFAGRLEEALQGLDAAMRRDPYPPTWVWEVRGSVLYQLARYDEAIDAFLRVSAHPFWMPAFLAAAYAQAGQLDSARRELSAFLKVRPGSTLSSVTASALCANKQWRDRLAEGLRKAGLPE